MLLACLAILKSSKEKRTLEEIYLQEGDDLLRYARAKLKDDALAEDMVADSFLKLAQNLVPLPASGQPGNAPSVSPDPTEPDH